MKPKFDVTRFVTVEEISPPYPRYRVASGNSYAGQVGDAIASIGLKHSGGYVVVLHLDSGEQQSFNPMQLFPEPPRKPAPEAS